MKTPDPGGLQREEQMKFLKNSWIRGSSWWFQPILKNISQIGSFPQVGMKIKKCLKPPGSVAYSSTKIRTDFAIQLVFGATYFAKGNRISLLKKHLACRPNLLRHAVFIVPCVQKSQILPYPFFSPFLGVLEMSLPDLRLMSQQVLYYGVSRLGYVDDEPLEFPPLGYLGSDGYAVKKSLRVRSALCENSGDSWMYPYQRTPMGNPYISPT